MIVLDTSGLFAYLNEPTPDRERIRRALEEDTGPLILSSYVLAELDHLVATGVGVTQELMLLHDVAAGAYELTHLDASELDAAIAVIERYREHNIGLADASIVVLAGRYGTDRVLTLDERHFRTLRTPAGKPFTILPTDA